MSIRPVVLLVLLLVCSALNSAPDSPAGRFDADRDLFLPQFDSKTDVDDLHSVAGVATLLRDPRLEGVDYHAVAGAYGVQEGLYVPSPELFDLAFGPRWSDAHEDRQRAVDEVAARVVATLRGGGDVWVAEAGQSDFTAAWLRRVRELGVPVDTMSSVHVVQHSDWNESVTSEAALAYVRRHADYRKIPDGNVAGNGSPGFRTESADLWAAVLDRPGIREIWRLARSEALAYNGREGRYLNEAVAAGGMDFSDVVESCWIFGFEHLADAPDFFSEFGPPNQAGQAK